MFKKRARAQVLASLNSAGDLKKSAQFNVKSPYADGIPQRIDIAAALRDVAEIYEVSADPTDYIFVIARAVSAQLSNDNPNPNENGDAFTKDELLRFDHRLARRVYKTFDLKPNHINHRAENPKTARGFIIDSTFNDADPNDQYVECLIAIDANKDKSYANGIREGIIDAFSMGCIAEYTICSVCANRATNRYEFCRHINGSKMREIDGQLVYEICGGVCFEELSAVDQPADPKALMQEILQLQAQRENLGQESELLKINSRIAKLEANLQGAQNMTNDKKKAQMSAPAIPPSVPPAPPVTAQEEEEVVGPPGVEPLGPPGVEPLAPPPAAMDLMEQPPEPMPFAGDDVLQIPEEEFPLEAQEPMSFADYKQQKEDEESAPMTDEEVGVMAVTCRKFSKKFAKKHADLQVDSTAAGNFRVYNHKTGRSLFALRPVVAIRSPLDAKLYCEIIARHIACYGLDGAMKKLKALRVPPRKGEVLDHDTDDMTDTRSEQRPSDGGLGDDDMTDPRGDMTSDSGAELDSDKEQEYPEGPGTSVDERISDMADASEADSPDSTRNPDSDKREDYDPYSVSSTGPGALGEEVHDHEERVAKVQTYFEKKLAALDGQWKKRFGELEAQIDKRAEQKARAMMQRFERCMQLAAERQRLNREHSPLKFAMAEALLQPCDINDTDRFPGIPTEITGLLVERGLLNMTAHVVELIKRAKELYGMDDRLLDDSEKDLRHAIAAPVVQASGGGRSYRSIDTEERLLDGNPIFTPSGKYSEEAMAEYAQNTGTGSRGRIRAALNKPTFVRHYEGG